MEIKEYTSEHIPAVQRFNKRLKAGGSNWGFYETERSDWVPVQEFGKTNVWRQFYVAQDAEGEVRGAYCLKPQLFRIAGKDVWLGTWQGPVSEGLIEPRYAMVGMMCVRDMLERNPLLFTWGSASDQLNSLLIASGWQTYSTPVLFRVVHPNRFFRHTKYIRNSTRNRIVLDLVASSGVGSVLLRTLHRLRARKMGSREQTKIEVCSSFGQWADTIWEKARDESTLIAVRDASTMAGLIPGSGWPHARVLRILVDDEVVGWAALKISEFSDDRRFGSLRVGSLIDSLAIPGHEASVLDASVYHLLDEGLDLLFTNYTHATWRAAFRGAGFLELPQRRFFAVSPKLAELLGPLDESTMDRFFLAPIDADGPHGL